MGILRYELKKIFTFKIVIIIFILLSVNFILLCSQALEIQIPEDVKDMSSDIESGYWESRASNSRHISTYYEDIFTFSETEKANLLRFAAILHGAEDSVSLSELQSLSNKYSDIIKKGQYELYIDALTYISDKYRPLMEYEGYLDTVQNQSETSSSISVFRNENDYSYKNILKTASDFSNISVPELHPVDAAGIDFLNQYYISDLIALVFILLVSLQLFETDRTYGMVWLINATYNGHKKHRFVQMIALIISVAAVGTIMYFFNIVTVNAILGIPHLNIAVQSMESFRAMISSLNIGQYLFLYILVKIAACILITCFVGAISIIFNSRTFIISVCGIVCGSSFLLWMYLPQSPLLKSLQYLNFFGIFDVYEIWAVYQNINFFSFPINLWKCSSIFSLGSSFVFLTIAVHVKNGRSIPSFYFLFPSHFSFPCRSTNIFKQEFHHILINQKTIFLLLAVLILSVFRIDLSEKKLTLTEAAYTEYIMHFSGTLDEQTDLEINQLKAHFDGLEEKMYNLNIKKNTQQLNGEEFRKEYTALLTDLEKREGFFKFWDQYQQVRLNIGTSNNVKLVNLLPFNAILGENSSYVTDAIIYIGLLLVSLGRIFDDESRNAVFLLIKTTKNGRTKYIKSKLTVGALIGAGIMLLISFPRWITIWSTSDVSILSASVKSIPQFCIGIDISIGAFFFLNALITLGIAASIGCIIVSIASFVKTQFATTVLGAIIFGFPTIFLYLIELAKNQLPNAFWKINIESFLLPYKFITNSWSGFLQNKEFLFLIWPLFCLILCLISILGYSRQS